ncbi:MAG: efflux RND transporter periplasmic adaptor subunit [Chloroflexota bacterium]|nr:efflux RND transporter periplasmic adaptor subunit [Chloroflexota bacterium]
MNFSKRTYVLIAGGAIVLFVAIVAIWVSRSNAANAAASALETAPVRRGTLIATVSATGAISPRREAQMAFSASGPLTQLPVSQGDPVKAGAVLASLDTRASEFQLAQSEASLTAAQAKLDQLKNPSPADVTAAQASVASAEAALAQLQKPTQNDLTIAKSDLDKAAAALSRAQSDYDRIGGVSNPFIGMTPQALTLQQAASDYQKALALFNAKINPNDSQLKQAQSALEQARAQLTRLTNPAPGDLQSAQAGVDQARAARDLSKARLDDAIIHAPYDGIVTHVDYDLGSFVPAGRALLGVADTSKLLVKLNIDETDIARVQVGEEVTIGLDAYPDVTINARVTDVAASATTIQGVVNYVVTVTLDPGAVPLKMGMTANANIVVARKDDVLLVPNQAVRAANNKHWVTVQTSPGKTEEVEVKIGLANDQETEVVSGLTEGQPVVTSITQVNPINSGGFGPPR